MPQLPSNVNYGTVVGQFVASVSDSVYDEDYNPDAKAMEGTITFTPSVPLVRNITADPNPITIVKTAIVGVLDDEGYLCSNQIDPDTGKPRRGITLVATDDEDLDPIGWNWVVTYRFRLDGWDIAGPNQHGLEVPTNDTIDLTESIPVTIQDGVPVIRGPKGETGDKGDQGIIGPTPKLTIGEVNTITTPGDDEWIAGVIQTGGLTKTAIQSTMPTTFKGDKGDPGGFTQPTSLSTRHLDDVVSPGIYEQSVPANLTAEKGYPVLTPGNLLVYARLASTNTYAPSVTQIYLPVWGTSRDARVEYRRVKAHKDAVWSSWLAYSSQRIDNTAGRAIYTWDDTANREQLIYGDTGTCYLNFKTLETPVVELIAGKPHIRRSGNTVTINTQRQRIVSTNGAGTSFVDTLPTGFRPHTLTQAPFLVESGNSNNVVPGQVDPGGTFCCWWTMSSGTLSGTMTWQTSDPWPTTLPA